MYKKSVFLLFLGSIAMSVYASIPPDGETKLRTSESGDFVTYSSSYFSLTCHKDMPNMASFSIQSGGRYRWSTLLRSGLGGRPAGDGFSSNITVKGLDERSFELRVTSQRSGFAGEFYQVCTAPDISPVTVWATLSDQPASGQYDRQVTFYKPRIIKASYLLPAILHFPDYGLVKVEASSDAVYMQEHIVPDDTNTGFPYHASGAHTAYRAYHKGSVILSFHTAERMDDVQVKFTVLDENYPQIEGCDFSSDRFDGLKRCWQNAFPVNPRQQTMGDNILLNGIGHLAMSFKADMLVFTPALPCSESMLDALKRALHLSFLQKVQESFNPCRCQGAGPVGRNEPLGTLRKRRAVRSNGVSFHSGFVQCGDARAG